MSLVSLEHFCAAMIQSFPPVDKTVLLCTEVHGSLAYKHQWSCVNKRDLLNQKDTFVVEEGICSPETTG